MSYSLRGNSSKNTGDEQKMMKYKDKSSGGRKRKLTPTELKSKR